MARDVAVENAVYRKLREAQKEFDKSRVSSQFVTENKETLDLLAELGVRLPKLTSEMKIPEMTPQQEKMARFLWEKVKGVLEQAAGVVVNTLKIETGLAELLKNANNCDEKFEVLKAGRNRIKELKLELDTAGEAGPEEFMALKGREFRKLVRNLSLGRLAQTEYVSDKLDEIVDRLKSGNVVLIHGETGTGKTEIAKLAALKLTNKPAIVVRGYQGMRGEEIFGHTELTASELKDALKLVQHVNQLKQDWDKSHPEQTPEDKLKNHELIEKAALGESSVTISKFIIGSVYQAALEGRTVVLDEFNYIPPPLLAKLNDILTKQPGEFITVQENGIAPVQVAEGFSLILTGNINTTGTERYQDRFPLGAALLDRIAVIKYDYLPQATTGLPERHDPAEKQLYSILLASLIDPKNVDYSDNDQVKDPEKSHLLQRLEDRLFATALPGGKASLNKLWELAILAKITQDNFAEKIDAASPNAFKSGGASAVIKTSMALSPRSLMSRVVRAWRDDGFKYELDYYVGKELLERSFKPEERAYFYQIAQAQGFFKSTGWEQTPNYGSGGKLTNFEVRIPRNPAAAVSRVTGEEILVKIYGEPLARKDWPAGIFVTVDPRVMTEALLRLRGPNDLLRNRLLDLTPEQVDALMREAEARGKLKNNTTDDKDKKKD